MALFLSILLSIGMILLSIFYFGVTMLCALLLIPVVIFLCIIVLIYYRIKIQYKKPEVFINPDVSEDNTNQNYGGD